MRLIILLFATFFMPGSLIVSGNDISFDTDMFRFGYKFQDDPPFTIVFRYENQGKEIVQLKSVQTTCGCIDITGFTQQLLPGGLGEITVLIDPSSQMGKMAETIEVYINNQTEPYILRIEGLVIAGNRNQEFNHQINGLYMPSKQVNFGYIYKGRLRKMALPLRSEIDGPIKIELKTVPQHLDVFVKPAIIEPDNHGLLDIQFHTMLIDEWGFVYHTLEFDIRNLKTNETVPGKITVTANIREDFSGLTPEDSLLAPQAVFDKNTFNFGLAAHNDTLSSNFTLTNTGENDLVIRKVKASCGCTVIRPLKETLRKGESTLINVSFITTGYKGSVKKGITVITNDPVNYKQYLWVLGTVKK